MLTFSEQVCNRVETFAYRDTIKMILFYGGKLNAF